MVCYDMSVAIQILQQPVSIAEVQKLADEWYGSMIKGCVDIVRNKVALGGDYHMESCEMLVSDGSNHNYVWGFNIRFENSEKGELEFDSLVNIKPALGNKSRTLEDAGIIEKASKIIRDWIIFD